MTGRWPPQRRLAFGRVAELYEQARPSYPQQLVDEVIAYAELSPGERILEVGAGTGKATRQFAAAGFEVIALEPSAEMAAVGGAACREFESVRFIESDFETWTPPPEPFRLIISAQAWHWIDYEVGYRQAHAALVRGGALAAFWSHVDWPASPLRAALDQAYREVEFAAPGPMHPRTGQGDLVPGWQEEIEGAPGFDDPEVRTYAWKCEYTAAEYVRLLGTHSDHVVLDQAVRQRLFEQVARAIEEHGGTLEAPYVTQLCLARAV